MKALHLSKNLLYYSAWLTLLTIIFRFSLSSLLQNQFFSIIWIVPTLYGISVFCLGWIFGKKDKLHIPLFDVGFRIHLATYLICNSIAEIWFLIGQQSDFENIRTIHLTAIYWGIFLLIHFTIYLSFRKNTIKGIKKSDIFE